MNTNYLSVAQYAAKQGVTRVYINQLIQQKRLQATKVGRAYIIAEEAMITLPVKHIKPSQKPTRSRR